jgi:hypothetical protein
VSTPEARFTNNVNRTLRSEICVWKISDRFTSGVPDCWYSGPKGDLWVEYKYTEKLPKRVPVKPDLSPRQRDWLMDRHREGRNVAVVVGSEEGAVIYPGISFEDPKPRDQLTIHSTRELREWIKGEVQ